MNQNLDINSCVVSTHFFYASLSGAKLLSFTHLQNGSLFFQQNCYQLLLAPFFPNKLSWSEWSETISWEILSERVHQSRRAAGPHPLIIIVPSAFPNSTNRSLQNWPNSSFRILGRTASSWRRKKTFAGPLCPHSPLTHQSLGVISLGVIPCSCWKGEAFNHPSIQQSPVGSKVHAHPWCHRSIPWEMSNLYILLGGFFPNQKFEKLWQLRQNGKNLPPTFWGKKMEKNIWVATTQFYPSRLKQHQKWHELIRPQTIRGAEVLQCLHGSHHLRHVGAETNQWCLLHPSQAPVGELGLTCTKSEKNISGNDHMGPTFHGKFGKSSTQKYL